MRHALALLLIATAACAQTRLQPSQVRNWSQVRMTGPAAATAIALDQVATEQNVQASCPILVLLSGSFACAGAVASTLAAEWRAVVQGNSSPSCYAVGIRADASLVLIADEGCRSAIWPDALWFQVPTFDLPMLLWPWFRSSS